MKRDPETRRALNAMLKTRYDAVTREPVPAEMLALLDRLK